MGKKIPFPVTKGPVGNKTELDDQHTTALSHEPDMQDLTRVYEDMTDHERRRTVEYLKGKGRGGTGAEDR